MLKNVQNFKKTLHAQKSIAIVYFFYFNIILDLQKTCKNTA